MTALAIIYTAGATLTFIAALSGMFAHGLPVRGALLGLLIAGAVAASWPFLLGLLAYTRWMEPQS